MSLVCGKPGAGVELVKGRVLGGEVWEAKGL